jgi:UDP-glucuronate decarboxylase
MTTRNTILVAGGAGFIGAHLCRTLLARGERVLCLDNFLTGREANIADLVGCEGFHLIRHDIIHPVMLQADAIYNLACPASPRHYQADPVHTLQTCLWGSMNLLKLARHTGARVLFASTSEVYGDPEAIPQGETYRGNVNPTGPRACYDEGKRAAETLHLDFARQYGVSVRIARIFNTFGPGMDLRDGRAVSNLMIQALQGQPMTIYGTGEQTRSFCYVADTVRGLVALMDAGGHQPDPVNLGNPEEITIRDLAERIARLVGGVHSIVRQPLPLDDPRRRCPDIERAWHVLGWVPTTPLDVGLALTAEDLAGRMAAVRGGGPVAAAPPGRLSD